MVIHKLIATCDCDNERCIGHGDGAIVNITLSAVDEIDIDLLTKLSETIEICASRVENVTINAASLPLLRAAIEDCYKLPNITERLMEIIGVRERKEEESPFDKLEELELKEIG